MFPNPPPGFDGAVNQYINEEAYQSPWFDHANRVIFINGMGNSPNDHRETALAISLLQMREVTGVYNQKSGFIGDLVQCLADKFQFDGPMASSASEALDRSVKKLGGNTSRGDAMEQALARNPACLSLFRVLRLSENRSAPIYAHSQGNLILSNVLTAIAAVDGPAAIAGREVHSYGSPSVNWPSGLKHQEYGFTFDPVTWLAGFDKSFSISKVGLHQFAGSGTLISHGFKVYAENDATFVINRFRWGSFGLTASLDEDGLAETLVGMGTNLPRVQAVFEKLGQSHNSDADDVAVLYVQKLQVSPQRNTIVGAFKQRPTLRNLLIRIMDEGWTSAEEKAAIAFLKAI